VNFLEEIRSQHPIVRRIMYWLAVGTTLGTVGFFWFTSIERNMFFAIHSDQQEREQFLARQEERVPQPLAFIGRGFGSLTASIGALLGFDSSKGFDKTGETDHNRDAVHLLPLSR
jgi:hypothetical protein